MNKIFKKIEIQQTIIDKVMADEKLRSELINEPKSVISKLLNVKIPDKFKILIHEDSSETIHIVLPPKGIMTDELNNNELDSVSGGNAGFAHMGWF